MKNNLDFCITFGHKEISELVYTTKTGIKKNMCVYAGAKCVSFLENNEISVFASSRQNNLIEYLIKTSAENLDVFLNENLIEYYSKFFQKKYEYFEKEKKLTDQNKLRQLFDLVCSYIDNKKNVFFEYEYSIYLKTVLDMELFSHFKKSYNLNSFKALKIYIEVKNVSTQNRLGDYLYLRESLEFIISNPNKVYEVINNIFEELSRSRINVPFSEVHRCIFSNQAACLLVHEIIGHLCEADNFYKQENLSKSIGKKICCSKIEVYDLANNFKIKSCPIVFKLDSEGTVCKDVKIVENGKIINLLTNKYYGNVLEKVSTGNARSCNIFSDSLVRMRNTYACPGEQSLKAMLEDIDYGIYIDQVSIGTFDVYGNFTLSVKVSYIIKRGVVRESILPFDMSGNCFDILESIISISNDLEWYIFDCCKYGQEIYVSGGCPKISCDINIKERGGEFYVTKK